MTEHQARNAAAEAAYNANPQTFTVGQVFAGRRRAEQSVAIVGIAKNGNLRYQFTIDGVARKIVSAPAWYFQEILLAETL